jgi:quercetin dioxygenase-like cupin family protein
MTVKNDIQIVDNVFVKMFHVTDIGDKIAGHAHTFDHITLLAKGHVIMRANGVEKQHLAPKLLVTPKGVVHEFEALVPGCILCCVHAIRDGDTEEDVAPPDITEEQAKLFMEQFPLVK